MRDSRRDELDIWRYPQSSDLHPSTYQLSPYTSLCSATLTLPPLSPACTVERQQDCRDLTNQRCISFPRPLTRLIETQDMVESFLKLELVIKVSRREAGSSVDLAYTNERIYIIGTNSALSDSPGVVSGRMTSQFLFQL